jgi:hypothetical protein
MRTCFLNSVFTFRNALRVYTYLLRGAIVFVELWPPHILCEVLWQQIFTGWGRQPHAHPPTWRIRVSLLVWHLPRNLSGMGGATSSCAAAGKALELIVAHKPPNPATNYFQQGGDTIEGARCLGLSTATRYWFISADDREVSAVQSDGSRIRRLVVRQRSCVK